MTTANDSPQLPQSTALSEASPDSLTELFSRDPEGYSKQDRVRIISAFREQRVKWQASEEAAPSRTRSAGAKADPKTLLSQHSADDLGL